MPDVACTSASHAHGWNCIARAQHSGVGVAATSMGLSQDWVAMESFWDWIWPTKGAHGEPGSCVTRERRTRGGGRGGVGMVRAEERGARAVCGGDLPEAGEKGSAFYCCWELRRGVWSGLAGA